MTDQFLREEYFSSAGHVIEGGEYACLVAVHLIIGRGDIDAALGALLVAPRLTRRWIATADAIPNRVRLVIYLQARHGTQAWRSAHEMQRLLRQDAVPTYGVDVTDAQDWTRTICDENPDQRAS